MSPSSIQKKNKFQSINFQRLQQNRRCKLKRGDKKEKDFLGKERARNLKKKKRKAWQPRKLFNAGKWEKRKECKERREEKENSFPREIPSKKNSVPEKIKVSSQTMARKMRGKESREKKKK